MPANSIRELTDLAIQMFEVQSQPDYPFRPPIPSGFGDPVLDGALSQNGVPLELFASSALDAAVVAVAGDPGMEVFAPRSGEPDPMLSSAMGGSRRDTRGLVLSIVASAQRVMYFDSVEQTPAALVQRVIENYEDLKKVGRGEPIAIRIVHGLAGVTLPSGAQISTPWGIVKPAPIPSAEHLFAVGAFRPATTAVLLRSHLCMVDVSRDASPTGPAPDVEVFRTEQRIRELLPLAFALAIEGERQCAPVLTFTTALPPFASGLGASSSLSPGSPWQQQAAVELSDLPAIEEWARRLNTNHVENLQVTARRIVSAIAERSDRSDALLDAVMAWESLVGTKNETVFRVTAALAKLIEANPVKRRELRRQLSGTYEVRSRVVHGEAVDPVKVGQEADKAIDVALSATRALYRRRPEWLTYTSGERADRLILEE